MCGPAVTRITAVSASAWIGLIAAASIALLRRWIEMRAAYKKYDELAAWDLDKGSRKYINQDSPANRRLKKKLRRQARKRLDKALWN
jgi:hypothetical protein